MTYKLRQYIMIRINIKVKIRHFFVLLNSLYDKLFNLLPIVNGYIPIFPRRCLFTNCLQYVCDIICQVPFDVIILSLSCECRQ